MITERGAGGDRVTRPLCQPLIPLHLSRSCSLETLVRVLGTTGRAAAIWTSLNCKGVCVCVCLVLHKFVCAYYKRVSDWVLKFSPWTKNKGVARARMSWSELHTHCDAECDLVVVIKKGSLPLLHLSIQIQTTVFIENTPMASVPQYYQNYPSILLLYHWYTTINTKVTSEADIVKM